MLLLFIIIYGIVLLILGIIAYKELKQPSDYYIAGKNKGTLQVTGSLLASILGGSAILGSVNLAMYQFWASAWYLLAISIGLFCLLPVVEKVNKKGKFTLSDLISNFYGVKAGRLAAFVIPLAWTGIVAAQIIASAKIMSTLFNIQYEYGVIISSAIFIIYTILGGQLSIIKTDFIQSIIIIIGVSISAIYIMISHGNTNVTRLQDTFPFNNNFGILDLLVLLLTFSSTFVVGPDIYSRIFCARNTEIAKKSVALSALIIIPIAFLLSYLGVFAAENLTQTQLHSVALVELIKVYLPQWMLAIMVVALLSAVLSSADTTLLTASMMLVELKNKNIDNRESLKETRIFILILGFISACIALFATSIINSLLLALSFYSGAFIIPIIMALWNIQTNKKMILPAMITGGLLALLGKIMVSYFEINIGNYLIIIAFIVSFIMLKIGVRKNNMLNNK